MSNPMDTKELSAPPNGDSKSPSMIIASPPTAAAASAHGFQPPSLVYPPPPPPSGVSASTSAVVIPTMSNWLKLFIQNDGKDQANLIVDNKSILHVPTRHPVKTAVIIECPELKCTHTDTISGIITKLNT